MLAAYRHALKVQRTFSYMSILEFKESSYRLVPHICYIKLFEKSFILTNWVILEFIPEAHGNSKSGAYILVSENFEI